MPLTLIKPFPDLKKYFPPVRSIIEQIKENIRREGFRSEEPIVVWLHQSTGVWYVVDGHQRYLAAVELGLIEVPVAIADFVTHSEIVDYLIARQIQRRQTDKITILNALLHATLYKRGGNPAKVPSGTSGETEGNSPASLEEIGQVLGISRRTVARVKQQYFDAMKVTEKNRIRAGDSRIEDVMVAVDDRREKKTVPQIVRLLSLLGVKEGETKKLVAKAESLGQTPRQFAAAVLRQALADTPMEVTEAPKVAVPATVSSVPIPPPETTVADAEEALPPSSTVSVSARETAASEKKVSKEKDWKQWHASQRSLLWHFYASNPGGTQIDAVRNYHADEQLLMGDKCHNAKAVDLELYRLSKKYAAGTPPPPLSALDVQTIRCAIGNLVAPQLDESAS